MSDDAADKTNTGADDAVAPGDRPHDSTDADVSAPQDADTAAAPAGEGAKDVPAKDDATVKLESAPTDQDATVKLPTAESKSAPTGDAPAYSPAAQQYPQGDKRGWVPIATAFAAGVVVVAAAAAVALFWTQDHDRGKELSQRAGAVAAACDFGHQVSTYDSAKFDDYIQRVKDRSAGDWLTQFDGASTALKQITQQAQARSTVAEIHCAWESSGGSDKASVVMLITQLQSKAATPQPQRVSIGVIASLEKKNGRWLVDNFQSPMTNDLQSDASAAPGADAPPPAPGANPPGPGN